MKRVVIHSGPGKTGTSAIQFWLNNNRSKLRDNSVYYPKHTTDTNGVSSGNIQAVLSQNNEGVWDVDAVKVEQLLKDFNQSECDVLLLSSEFFFYKIGHFVEKVNSCISTVNSMIFIRIDSQIKLLISLY